MMKAKNENIKVSIIVPLYNVEMYINECLDSLVNQTLESKEIIIVNDGSTDRSREIAAVYQREYDFITIVDKKNGGLSSARNTGLKKAKGEYIIFIDSDDYIDTDAVEYFYNLADSHKLDIIRGKYYVHYEADGKVDDSNKDIYNPNENTVISGEEFLKQAIDLGYYEVVSWINLYKKDYLIDNNLYFREGVSYEDHEHTLKALIGQPCRLMQTDKIFYYYRQRPESITKNPNLKKAIDIIENLKYMVDFIKTIHSSEEAIEYSNRAVSMLLYQLTSVYGRLPSKERKKLLSSFDKKLGKQAMGYSVNNHQRWKIRIFVYTPLLVDVTYALKNMQKNIVARRKVKRSY